MSTQSLPQTKRYLTVGEQATITMPWSEVCMSMRVAGRPMVAQLLPGGMVQLFDDRGPFSFPITSFEAGIYQDADGYCYYG